MNTSSQTTPSHEGAFFPPAVFQTIQRAPSMRSARPWRRTPLICRAVAGSIGELLWRASLYRNRFRGRPLTRTSLSASLSSLMRPARSRGFVDFGPRDWEAWSSTSNLGSSCRLCSSFSRLLALIRAPRWLVGATIALSLCIGSGQRVVRSLRSQTSSHAFRPASTRKGWS